MTISFHTQIKNLKAKIKAIHVQREDVLSRKKMFELGEDKEVDLSQEYYVFQVQ